MVEGHWNCRDLLCGLKSRDRLAEVDMKTKEAVDRIGVPVVCFSMPCLIMSPRV